MSKKVPEGRATPSPEERNQKQVDREAAFKRLAVKRVNKAIKAISLVANLASYKPSLEYVASIENALVKAHNDTVGRLKGTAKSVGSFTL